MVKEKSTMPGKFSRNKIRKENRKRNSQAFSVGDNALWLPLKVTSKGALEGFNPSIGMEIPG